MTSFEAAWLVVRGLCGEGATGAYSTSTLTLSGLCHLYSLRTPSMDLPPVMENCDACDEEPGPGAMLRCSVCKNRFYCVRRRHPS